MKNFDVIVVGAGPAGSTAVECFKKRIFQRIVWLVITIYATSL